MEFVPSTVGVMRNSRRQSGWARMKTSRQSLRREDEFDDLGYA